MIFKKILKLLFVLILIAGIALASFTFGKSFSDNDDNSDVKKEDSGISYLNNLVTDGTNLAVSQLNSDGSYSAIEKDVSIFRSDVIWTPGHKETVTLTIANNGNDTVRYSLGVNSADETAAVDASGKEVKLSDTLQFGFANSLSDTYEIPTSKALNSGYGMVGTLEKGCSQTLVLVVYLPETAEDIFAKADISLGIRLLASQPMNGDVGSESISGVAGFNASANLEGVVENGSLSAPVAIGGSESSMSAVVPSGVKLEDGASQLTLSVNNVDNSAANITLGQNDSQHSLDIHVSGVAEDNDIPMEIMLRGVASAGLNSTSIKLYHVENGQTIEMISLAATEPFSAHNQFKYDPITGNITIYIASFSEVAVVADVENAWKGNYDYTWFVPNSGNYTIANAEQLAAFGAIVGGMQKVTGKDAEGNYTYDGYAYTNTEDVNKYHWYTFEDETVTLLADINIGDVHTAEVDASENGIVFYPIGYWNSTEKYEKAAAISVNSSVYSFEGTFDGNGHKVYNFHHNTWEMFGDYNDGYSGTPNHYKDGMGLFGYVFNGTIKNLTVENYSSDGEFAPTGVIAAYASNSTFENIAIVDCNPRVYNTGNGGIVGIGGNSDDPDTYNLTFNNITIDNSNKITALWGSWDVACGGLVGMFRGAGHVYMTNCHVAAQIDVYNDVCGNYQYYWYRYSGMLIGTNKNMITDENGYTVPETEKFHAKGCTVHFGDWNDYYYCELVANSLASYTHDHQFSRLTEIQSVSEIQDENGNWNTTGNFILMNGKTPTDTCYHIMKDADGNLYEHKHDVADATNPNVTETVNGETVLKENNQRIHLPFNQLFTGYGWGVKHIPIYDDETPNPFAGVTVLDRVVADSVEKFQPLDSYKNIITGTTIKVGDLFAALNNLELGINDSNVQVTISPADEKSTVTGIYKADLENWLNGTITISGNGTAIVGITDYFFCKPAYILINVYNVADSYKAELNNNYTSYKEHLHEFIYTDIGAWGIETNGKYTLDTEAGTPDTGGIGNLTEDGKYLEYEFFLNETAVVDIIWSVAGVCWKNNPYENEGITNLDNCSDVFLDGKAVSVSGFNLKSGTSIWWNLNKVVISDIVLEAGRHTFRYECKSNNWGVNVGSMTVRSDKEVGVKFATVESVTLEQEDNQIYYTMTMDIGKFTKQEDIKFWNEIGGTIIPFQFDSFVTDENGIATARIKVTNQANSDDPIAPHMSVDGQNYINGKNDKGDVVNPGNNKVKFEPTPISANDKTYFLHDYWDMPGLLVVANDYIKIVGADLYWIDGKLCYTLTCRMFNYYDPSKIEIFDGGTVYETTYTEDENTAYVTYMIVVTKYDAIWPHIRYDGKKIPAISNDNFDVLYKNTINAKTYEYGDYNYTLECSEKGTWWMPRVIKTQK